LTGRGVEIHQIIVSAAPGDAVTDAAFGLRDVLRRVGPSEIFAHHVDGSLAGEVGRLTDYAARPGAAGGGNVLVYHASIGEPAVCSFLLERAETLVLLYHNVPPAGYFVAVDPAVAALLADGRVELAALRPRVSLALATSDYNAADLRALGFDDVRLSPLPVDTGRLPALESDPATVAHLDEHLGGPLVLSVGPVLPHQRPDLLLAAYHVLVTYLVPDAYLALVGPCPLPGYRRVLESYRLQLNLHRAWLPGPVGPAALAAWYRAAAVFVTVSEHEGVCVPALEAMAFDVPVVARAFAAVPETLGGAGLLLPPDDDPGLVAEALAEVLGGDGTRRTLVAAGRRRHAGVEPERARAAFLAHLAGTV
jgi:glycosyltransferase involved in cell wall biosynthesis